MRATVAGIALLLVLGPVVASEAAPAFTPSAALAVRDGASTVRVAWMPGDEMPDAYRVFGLGASGWQLLEERSASEGRGSLTAEVPGDLTRYGVAGVRDGTQSPIVGSVVATPTPCVWITTSPAGAGHDCEFPDRLRAVAVVWTLSPIDDGWLP